MKLMDITTIPERMISNKIHEIRGRKVMLDSDLATLYAVQTKESTNQLKEIR